jgi:ribosomal protein S6--L-glutamate ligase/tetrahydromethanopterin:alpha-L-glutamate ligase
VVRKSERGSYEFLLKNTNDIGKSGGRISVSDNPSSICTSAGHEMGKIGIFTSNEKDWNVRQLVGELERRGREVVCFPIDALVARISGEPKVSCAGHDLEGFDALVVRWVPGGSAEQLVFRMDALHRLENLGKKVLNPAAAIERCADKFYTCALLEDAGISVPKTVVAENYGDAMRAFSEFKDVVVKPLFGSLGVGMLRVDSRDLAYRVFKALEFGRSVYYIQEFIPHPSEDIRIFVVDGEAVASMRRRGHTWKTNVSRGAEVHPHDPNDELKEMSVKAAGVLGCEYAGVDLIECGGRYYITEVNAIPGWRGLQSVTRVNIAEKIIDLLLE